MVADGHCQEEGVVMPWFMRKGGTDPKLKNPPRDHREQEAKSRERIKAVDRAILEGMLERDSKKPRRKPKKNRGTTSNATRAAGGGANEVAEFVEDGTKIASVLATTVQDPVEVTSAAKMVSPDKNGAD